MSRRTTRSTTDDIAARRQRVIEQIAELGPVLPGSLVTRSSRCGNPNCHCHTDPSKMHGPYPTWTRSVGGRTITRALTPEQADRARVWFGNARRLRELTDALKRLGIEHAQTDEQWPTT